MTKRIKDHLFHAWRTISVKDDQILKGNFFGSKLVITIPSETTVTSAFRVPPQNEKLIFYLGSNIKAMNGPLKIAVFEGAQITGTTVCGGSFNFNRNSENTVSALCSIASPTISNVGTLLYPDIVPAFSNVLTASAGIKELDDILLLKSDQYYVTEVYNSDNDDALTSIYSAWYEIDPNLI